MRWKHVHLVGVQRTIAWSDYVLRYQTVRKFLVSRAKQGRVKMYSIFGSISWTHGKIIFSQYTCTMFFEHLYSPTHQALRYWGQFVCSRVAVLWKSTFQYVRVSFCSENVGNWSTLPQNDSELSPRSMQSCFQLLQGPSCRMSPPALFRSKWVKCDYDFRSDRFFFFFISSIGDCSPVGSKKRWRWFPSTGPLEKRGTALDRSWWKLKSFWGEEDQLRTISG